MKYIRVRYKAGNQSIFSLKTAMDAAGYVSSLKLFYSGLDSGWSAKCKGKLAAKLTNTGDGFVIKVDGKTLELDYAQAELLQTLLNEETTISGDTTEVDSFS